MIVTLSGNRKPGSVFSTYNQVMKPTLSLVSIQVGMPQTYSDPDRTWTSGIAKRPVTGPVQAGLTNLAGDGQADLVHHGGVDKAIYCYPSEHYPAWRSELALPDLPYGGLGENFTTGGLLEEQVCIGDTWQIGEAVVQVSQPRRPCYKLNRLWSVPDLDARVNAARRCGWYLRVLKPGSVEAGQAFVFIERPAPDWNIERVYAIAQDIHAHSNDATALLDLEVLSADWRDGIKRILRAR